MCAISASDCDKEINNCSRSGLRCSGPRIGVVLRARRLDLSIREEQKPSKPVRIIYFSSGELFSKETFGIKRELRSSSALDER